MSCSMFNILPSWIVYCTLNSMLLCFEDIWDGSVAKLCLCWLSPEVKRCICVFCYNIFLIRFHICNLIAVTQPFKKTFHFSPIYADFWSQQKNIIFQPLGADYVAPFEACSGTFLWGQLWSISLDVACKKFQKIIILFWFQTLKKYGIKVSWPNKLSIFIFMTLHKIFSLPLFYT